MPSVYEKVVSLIQKVPEKRADFECVELIGWFRNKASVFQAVKGDIVKDVIKHCSFERKVRDEVIIKQGENGEKLYIILKGSMDIYVYNEKDNEQDILQHVERACAKIKLDRSQLGQHVWTSEDGHSVGEIALIKEDCIRTASVVVNTETDLMVVDRALYNRSVKEVLEKEFNEKTEFVETNPLFRHWTPRLKKSLAIALKKEAFLYGCPLTKQGQLLNCAYFIRSGEAEVRVDQGAHRSQYPNMWADMEKLLPELLPSGYGAQYKPFESLKQRKIAHKCWQMCLLGRNEIVGALELVLGLDTHLESCIVTRTSDVFVLSKANYHRLFNRRSSFKAVEALRNILSLRLYLYIHRSQLSDFAAPFLKFLTIKLRHTDALKRLRSKHRRRRYTERDFLYYGFYEYTRLEKHDIDLVKLMKVLDIHYMCIENCLPQMETSTHVLTDLDKRMKDWATLSKGTEDTPRPQTTKSPTATVKKKRGKYRAEVSSAVSAISLHILNEPPKLEAYLRPKTTSRVH